MKTTLQKLTTDIRAIAEETPDFKAAGKLREIAAHLDTLAAPRPKTPPPPPPSKLASDLAEWAATERRTTYTPQGLTRAARALDTLITRHGCTPDKFRTLWRLILADANPFWRTVIQSPAKLAERDAQGRLWWDRAAEAFAKAMTPKPATTQAPQTFAP